MKGLAPTLASASLPSAALLLPDSKLPEAPDLAFFGGAFEGDPAGAPAAPYSSPVEEELDLPESGVAQLAGMAGPWCWCSSTSTEVSPSRASGRRRHPPHGLVEHPARHQLPPRHQLPEDMALALLGLNHAWGDLLKALVADAAARGPAPEARWSPVAALWL
jgi:hypothetical protein